MEDYALKCLAPTCIFFHWHFCYVLIILHWLRVYQQSNLLTKYSSYVANYFCVDMQLSTRDPWSFAQLRKHLQSMRGAQAAEAVFRNMQLAITQLLLRAEPHVANYYSTIGGDPITGNLFRYTAQILSYCVHVCIKLNQRCLNCYQLLGIDLNINSSLHVMISEVIIKCICLGSITII